MKTNVILIVIQLFLVCFTKAQSGSSIIDYMNSTNPPVAAPQPTMSGDFCQLLDNYVQQLLVNPCNQQVTANMVNLLNNSASYPGTPEGRNACRANELPAMTKIQDMQKICNSNGSDSTMPRGAKNDPMGDLRNKLTNMALNATVQQAKDNVANIKAQGDEYQKQYGNVHYTPDEEAIKAAAMQRHVLAQTQSSDNFDNIALTSPDSSTKTDKGAVISKTAPNGCASPSLFQVPYLIFKDNNVWVSVAIQSIGQIRCDNIADTTQRYCAFKYRATVKIQSTAKKKILVTQLFAAFQGVDCDISNIICNMMFSTDRGMYLSDTYNYQITGGGFCDNCKTVVFPEIGPGNSFTDSWEFWKTCSYPIGPSGTNFNYTLHK